MKQIHLFQHLSQDPDQKLTVVRYRKTARGNKSWDYSTLTRAEIKHLYPKWNGESHILRVDYRSGLSVTIKELKDSSSKKNKKNI